MKPFFFLLITAWCIIVIQTSCNKTVNTETPQQEKPPIRLDSMLLCHQQTIWDSTAIHNALIGKWKWEYIKCYWKPESANSEEFKTLSIEFKNNDSIDVKTNDQITQKSLWSIVKLNDGYFKLLVNPIVYQLPGKILFVAIELFFMIVT